MNYQKILSFQPILNPNTINLIEALCDGKLTKDQFHNRKSYARRTNNIVKVLEYSVAWEIFNMIKGSKE